MDIEARYLKTLEYLYSFVDYSLTKAVRYSPEQFNLQRMQAFVAALGHPQQAYPLIHIAGTKGKGSTAALCASALQAAGYRVGLYTSPHLVDYCERLQVDRQSIGHAELVALVDEIKPQIEQIEHLTTFEITTGLAFLHFARQEVQAAVIEVGLGGRLDATNVVNPAVSVITSLSYDHTQFLGDTLAEIAGEKAGIIKPGRPVVLAPQKDEARHVIERVAAERNAPLLEVGKDFLFAGLEHSVDTGQALLVWPAAEQAQADRYLENVDPSTASGEQPSLRVPGTAAGEQPSLGAPEAGGESWPLRLQIPLLGQHQVENAATAFSALQVFGQQALPVSRAAILQGFARVAWPGRFEILQRCPPVVLDCAHNRDSALKLRLALDDYFPGLPVVLVFGASEDKDIEGMFVELLPRVQQVIATRSFHPRAIDPEKLVALAHRDGRPARVIEKVEEALPEAIRLAGQEALVLVTGSIFVAAAARDSWYNDIKL